MLFKRIPMSEITSAQMLDDIEKKVRKLLQRNERLEAENAELQKSIFEYIAQMDLQKKEMNQLRDQLQASRIRDGLGSSDHKLYKELDQYIKLIDKCIAAVQVKI